MTDETKTGALVRVEPQQHVMRREPDLGPPISFDDLVRQGTQLVATGFLPQHIRTGPQFAAIVMTGRELGMAPMRAIRSFHLLKGKVVEDAASQLSRFKAQGGRSTVKHGQCGYEGCRAPVDEKTGLAFHHDAEHCSMWLRHPNGDETIETFTMEDARSAGLLSNDNWRKGPKAMLRSRAITAGLKSVGWEGSVGAYDPDEARGFADDEPAPPVAQAAHRRAPAREEREVRAVPERSAPQRAAPSDLEPVVGEMPAWDSDRVEKRPAAPKRSATALICLLLDRADAATSVEEIESVQADWVKLEESIAKPTVKLAMGAYLAVTAAPLHGLTYEPSVEEAAAMAELHKIRVKHGSTSTPPVDAEQ
jgi:hypothetical protein